ncbi:MAG: hypothetical protein QMD94_05875 [Candidatus Omnitrophota bacterium]|nr:hypothetical protein [Candidatus Omnitrophota bacterium]
MCFSACHWARISRIIYGAGISGAKRCGFSELAISNKKMKKIGQSSVKITKDFLRQENLRLFKFWQSRQDKRVY